MVEAYPKLVVNNLTGRKSYKSDDKKKQTEEQKRTREELVTAIRGNDSLGAYGLKLRMRSDVVNRCIQDPAGDLLDAVLCSVQAAWAYARSDSDYGMNMRCDPLEGWIADPCLLGNSTI